MKYDLLKEDILATLCDPTDYFDFTNPPCDPVDLSTSLIETLYHYKGLGLAANQCGLPYRMFVMVGGEEDFAMFNPTIVEASDQHIYLDEGCLSFPGLFCKVKRPSAIRVRFSVPSGEYYTKEFAGITARVIQHECDHLDGVLFYNRATLFHREAAFRNKLKYDRKVKAAEKALRKTNRDGDAFSSQLATMRK